MNGMAFLLVQILTANAFAMASLPEMRITPIAPAPEGVANAIMVSFGIMRTDLRQKYLKTADYLILSVSFAAGEVIFSCSNVPSTKT